VNNIITVNESSLIFLKWVIKEIIFLPIGFTREKYRLEEIVHPKSKLKGDDNQKGVNREMKNHWPSHKMQFFLKGGRDYRKNTQSQKSEW
jgi:hypothetical protein